MLDPSCPELAILTKLTRIHCYLFHDYVLVDNLIYKESKISTWASQQINYLI